jgi:YD repeat-containing protein
MDPKSNVWSATYDMAGRRLSASDADLGTWSFTYDGASNMLTQRGVGTYVNGASVGQNTADARTLPHATASVTVSGVTRRTFDYDLNGNQIGRRSYSSAGAEVPAQARTIVYDRENRPTQVTLGDTVAGDYVTTVALYGPEGERLRKDVKTTTDGVTTTTQSTWFLGPDVEYDATGRRLDQAAARRRACGGHRLERRHLLGASRPAGLGDGGKRCHRQAGAGEALFALRSARGPARRRRAAAAPAKAAATSASGPMPKPASSISMPAGTMPSSVASSPPTGGTPSMPQAPHREPPPASRPTPSA